MLNVRQTSVCRTKQSQSVDAPIKAAGRLSPKKILSKQQTEIYRTFRDMGGEPNIRILDDSEQVAGAAAERFVALARDAIARQGRFSVMLAGGSTPRRAYELIASQPFREQIDWSRVHIFFGDERPVPSDHADSNFRMAHVTLISKLSIPPENVHRLSGEGDASANAAAYEAELRRYFHQSSWPQFDLVLLGIGDDCHTASLFPGTSALRETVAWVAANWVDKLNSWRTTLTPPAINHAAHVIFLVTGRNKARCVAEVLYGSRDPERLPAQLIEPEAGKVEWLIDRDAASHLGLEDENKN